ncbi:MAG: hypothetical protein NTW85_00930 [Methylococcales bacterium]|nr:hypothetical protein [Methylococcales bacterium]
MNEQAASSTTADLYLELITQAHPDRPNRLCVVVSDLHFTDATVGVQNLEESTWNAFYNSILQRCLTYYINELVLVLDGDIIDMVRSSKWAEKGVYPWERERTEDFSSIVNAIITDIVEVKHRSFFAWLKGLEENLKRDTKKLHPQTAFEKVKLVITVGNHDKELLCDNAALTYFYEQGLGIKLTDIDEERRKLLGRMYGDEQMFLNTETAPYFPFYYGDTGFRFFTTHGQWRDKNNCAKISAENDFPAWSVEDGWNIKTWQALKFSPFFKPCFGDSVAAGVLSTFIYKTKKQLAANGYHTPVINTVLDELDLYRPTFAAIGRILELTAKNRKNKTNLNVVQIIEDTLYDCLMVWLNWDFTLQSSPLPRKVGLIIAKWLLKFLKLLGHNLHISGIAGLVKILKIGNLQDAPPAFHEMKKFPSFLPAYSHYGFQIHGEGHTHEPLQEEPNIENEQHCSTYINFGTWRDQIVPRKEQGYRRRGMLRALFILDLKNLTETQDKFPRSFDYFVIDAITWSDLNDNLTETGKRSPKI